MKRIAATVFAVVLLSLTLTAVASAAKPAARSQSRPAARHSHLVAKQQAKSAQRFGVARFHRHAL